MSSAGGTSRRTARTERGAVLGVGLVLLLLLTLLGLAGMTAATAALLMAGQEQRALQAFDAAETGITRILRAGLLPAAGVSNLPAAVVDAAALPQTTVAVQIATLPCAAPCPPPAGFSLDTSGEALAARYYTITSTGTSLGARAVHEQVAYVFAVED